MLEQFTKLEDLQAFAKAQQKTIVELTKKNTVLSDKVKQLEKLLETTVPVIQDKKIDFGVNDEETIARQQLFLLKQKSQEEELTLEETRRVEIYSKILINLKDKPKTLETSSRQLSEDELLQITQTAENKNDDRENKH